MDALKKFAGKSESTGNTNNAQQSGEKKDIGDRGRFSYTPSYMSRACKSYLNKPHFLVAGFINKKEGNRFSDQQLETGTDKARELYEKATG